MLALPPVSGRPLTAIRSLTAIGMPARKPASWEGSLSAIAVNMFHSGRMRARAIAFSALMGFLFGSAGGADRSPSAGAIAAEIALYGAQSGVGCVRKKSISKQKKTKHKNQTTTHTTKPKPNQSA